MLPFHLPAVSGLGCWMLLCFLPRRQVSNRFLCQRMHILLVFICRFPWGSAYQKECSLGNSCKWHGVCTAVWNQSWGSRAGQWEPEENSSMGNGNSFFLSRCLTDASLRVRKKEGVMKLQCGGRRADTCQTCTPPQSQEQFKHSLQEKCFKYRTDLSAVSADIPQLFNFSADSHQLRIRSSISLLPWPAP